jgi:peptide/nickel transport system permease protein
MEARYILRRLCYCGLAFFASITITFLLLYFMPGDYITHYFMEISRTAPLDIVEHYRHVYGMDQPLLEQYANYVVAIIHGDWGYSLEYGLPVFSLIGEKLYWTLLIMVPSLILSTIIGGGAGAWSGWKRGTRGDMTLLSSMLFFRAIPSYWLAIMVMLVFACYLGWFPIGGYMSVNVLYSGYDIYDVLHHAALPILTTTLLGLTGTYYLMRNSMLMTIGEDYITTARAKGLKENVILRKHAARNALLPMVTMVSMQCAHMITGSIFIETIFSWPGMGMLTFNALDVRDIPLLQGIFLMDALVLIAVNFAADMLYPLVDPRVEEGTHE